MDFMFGGMEPKRITARNLNTILQKYTVIAVVTECVLHYTASVIGLESSYSSLPLTNVVPLL
jgi:hypothetical protein